MKRISVLFISVMVILSVIVATPALAYATKDLNININDDGSAVISGSYVLSWTDIIAFTMMPNKEQTAENALNSMLGKGATVNYITNSGASATVPGFASVKTTDEGITYTTPRLPFNKLGEYIDKYADRYMMLKPLIPPTDSIIPAMTVITFPDGYSVVYSKPYPGDVVPSITH